MLLLGVFQLIGGGAAKLLFAIVPWFSFDAFMIVFIGSMLIVAATAKMQKTEVAQIAPGVVGVGLLALVLS